MPLTVARHCSMVEKPQFLPPPSSPPVYWAHQEYSISARAGVADIDAMTARMNNANADFCMTYAPVGDLGYNLHGSGRSRRGCRNTRMIAAMQSHNRNNLADCEPN